MHRLREIAIATCLLAALGYVYWFSHFWNIASPAIDDRLITVPTSTQEPATQDAATSAASQPRQNLPSVNDVTSPGLVTELGSPYGCYDRVGDTIVVYVFQGSVTPTAEVLAGADAGSFQDLSENDLCFGRDRNHVYFYDQVLPWADPNTFAVLAYLHGSGLILRNGDELITWGVDDPSMPAGNCLPAPNGAGNFCILPNSDAATFQLIPQDGDGGGWAKDKNNVYCRGRIIQGADPSTAQFDEAAAGLRVAVNGVPRIYNFACAVVSDTSST